MVTVILTFFNKKNIQWLVGSVGSWPLSPSLLTGFIFILLLVCLFVFCFFRKPQFFQYSKLDAYCTMKRFWSTF